jgi:hypothetical protein
MTHRFLAKLVACMLVPELCEASRCGEQTGRTASDRAQSNANSAPSAAHLTAFQKHADTLILNLQEQFGSEGVTGATWQLCYQVDERNQVYL